ncbi:MAG: hypothetical protein ACLPWO_04505 [Thermoplasmata archaeon]
MPTKRPATPKPARGWKISRLPALGPASELREELRLFGQFVGSWEILEHRYPRSRQRTRGEVHFNWILDGRAVQDVWGSLDPSTHRFVPWGTTIRYYDPRLGAWRSTWIAPRQKAVRRFIGRKVGDEIVLQEEDRGDRTERWVFSDIRPDSFRWYALKRPRGGGPWRMIEEMKIRRQVDRRTRPGESRDRRRTRRPR